MTGVQTCALPILDYNQFFPELHGYLIAPLICDPPMCQLKELSNGTYSIYDLEMMHQIIEVKKHMNYKPPPSAPAPTLSGVTGV